MKFKRIIKKILLEETNTISQEIEDLIIKQNYLDEIYNGLQKIHQNNLRNNKERILSFIPEFSRKLDSFHNQVYFCGKNAEKILELINEPLDLDKTPIFESESIEDLGFSKFNDYFRYMYYEYNKIQKLVNEIKQIPTSDLDELKPKIEEYYNLMVKDNNSMFEFVKAFQQYLRESYSNISSGKTSKTSEKQGTGIDWSTKQIVKRNSNSSVIYLSPQKVLDRAGRDMGVDFDIRNQDVRIGDRLEKATEWLKNPNTEAYQPTMLYVETFYYDNNNQKRYYDEPKVGVSDGRHRLLAAANLGLPDFPFEVFNTDEEQQIKDVKYLEQTLK